MNRTEFCDVMTRYGSDKGLATRHNYTVYYQMLFQQWRTKPIRIFEMGLGTNYTDVESSMGKGGSPGASLRGWAELFPRAEVFGADIDTRILFQTDRIRTFACDQTDPESLATLWSNRELQEPFQIMIDDGLHTVEAAVTCFESSIHKLAPGGFYCIEDMFVHDFPKLEGHIFRWEKTFPHLEFQLQQLPHTYNIGDSDNTLLIVRNKGI